jgi:hypothetical protein
VPGEAREVHSVLFGAGGFVSKHIAFIHLIVGVEPFPSFRVTETVEDSTDVVVSCAVKLVNKKAHSLAGHLSYLSVRAGVRRMYRWFAVTEDAYRRSWCVM